MTREDFINIIKDINEKFRLYKETETDNLHFEILHVSLIETMNAE